jgi:hypothetical protein
VSKYVGSFYKFFELYLFYIHLLVDITIFHVAITGTLFTVQQNLNLLQTFLITSKFQAKQHEINVNRIDINLINIMRMITKGK